MILDELAAHARERVAADKAKISFEDMKAQAEALPQGDFRFEKALAGRDCAFICEVKKASPSKGVIDPVFDFEAIAQSYESAGADCVSCLTEPKWFLGSDEIFKKVRGIVTKPMIRKDFTVDEYQIYQAKVLGADAVLLTASDVDGSAVGGYDAVALGCPAMGSEVLEDMEFEPMFDGCKSSLKGKRVALFGSYGWGGGEWMHNWERDCRSSGIQLACDSVICNEAPDDAALAACQALGKALVG